MIVIIIIVINSGCHSSRLDQSPIEQPSATLVSCINETWLCTHGEGEKKSSVHYEKSQQSRPIAV